MAAAKKSADSFGTFLETLAGGPVPASSDPGLHLLAVLDRVGPSTRAELFRRSELDLVSFAAGFEAVKTSGFVTSHGTSADEVLELTASGHDVLSTP